MKPLFFLLLFSVLSFSACQNPKAEGEQKNAANEQPAQTPDGYERQSSFYEIDETPQEKWKIQVEEKDFNFGTHPLNKPVHHRFKFKNISQERIQISTVSAECGCTGTDFSKEILEPGGEGYADVTYDNAKPGKFQKRVTLRFNTIPPTAEPEHQNIAFKVETLPAADSLTAK